VPPNLDKPLPPLPGEPPKLSQPVPPTQSSTRYTVTHQQLKGPASIWQPPRAPTPPNSKKPPSRPPTPYAEEKLEAVDSPRPQFTVTHKPLQAAASTWQPTRPPTPYKQPPHRTSTWPRELLEHIDQRIDVAARAYVRELPMTPMDDLD
jgi:hypothetical protein